MQAYQLATLLPLLAAPLGVVAYAGGACNGGDGQSIVWSGNAENAWFTFNGGASTGPATGCTDLGAGFTGQVGVAYQDSNRFVSAAGSIIETNPSGDFDVSYVLGYSLPIVCSSGNTISGCSKDLFGAGNPPCPYDVVDGVCPNPTGPSGSRNPQTFNGDRTAQPWCNACSPPDPFFAACSGSAYTYPYDDGANTGQASGGSIQCCVGTACPDTGREGSASNGNNDPGRNCVPCGTSGKRSLSFTA